MKNLINRTPETLPIPGTLLNSEHRVPNGKSESRRVAMISTHGYVAASPILGAADTGGQVVYVIELSKQLARLGYLVDIWTRHFEDQPEVEPVCSGVRIIRIPCGGSKFIPKEYLHESLEEWVSGAMQLIRENRLNYEFLNSHYWDAGIAGRGLAEKLNVPHYHTPHSLGIWKMRQMEADFPNNKENFEARYNFTVRNREEHRLYQDSDRILATTPVQIDMLVEDYALPLAKLCLVSPGYDESRFFPVSSATRTKLRHKFHFEGKVILALGRLARNKGYDLLIRAFREVLERVPDAYLHLAVGGEEMNDDERHLLVEYKNLAATLGLSQRVCFTGYVRDEDLADFYRAADVFALSSRYEPFGMTVIEAMACGTPVVASINGGFWQVLQYGVDGLFADPFDTLDFGITLSKPLRYSKLAKSLSRRGAEHAVRSFTWPGIARQFLAASATSKGSVAAEVHSRKRSSSESSTEIFQR